MNQSMIDNLQDDEEAQRLLPTDRMKSLKQQAKKRAKKHGTTKSGLSSNEPRLAGQTDQGLGKD